MLLDETTGSNNGVSAIYYVRSNREHTVKIASDCGFNQRFHPFSDHELFIVTEVVCLIRVVDHPEPVPARIHFLIRYDLVS